MKRILLNLIFIVTIMACPLSCKFIMNEAIFTNRCERWEVVDKSTGQILWEKEGCGGDITNLKQQARVEALNQYESEYGNRFEIRSVSWDKAPEGVTAPR